MKQLNVFDNKLRYKMYCDMEKIIHPAISKRNISRYKIVLSEEITPIRVFYPQKISHLKDVIIYVHGISSVSGCFGCYSDICMNLAISSNRLVIAIDYDENKKYLDILDDCSNCARYLCAELNNFGIDKSHISLMGDSIGATLVLGINKKLEKILDKCILVSPILSGNYFKEEENIKKDKDNEDLVNNIKNYYSKALKFKKNYKDSFVFPLLSDENNGSSLLITVGEKEFLKDEASKYSEITGGKLLELPSVRHGFLKDMDFDIKASFYNSICDFLE